MDAPFSGFYGPEKDLNCFQNGTEASEKIRESGRQPHERKDELGGRKQLVIATRSSSTAQQRIERK
jgi:hypothetical protein